MMVNFVFVLIMMAWRCLAFQSPNRQAAQNWLWGSSCQTNPTKFVNSIKQEQPKVALWVGKWKKVYRPFHACARTPYRPPKVAILVPVLAYSCTAQLWFCVPSLIPSCADSTSPATRVHVQNLVREHGRLTGLLRLQIPDRFTISHMRSLSSDTCTQDKEKMVDHVRLRYQYTCPHLTLPLKECPGGGMSVDMRAFTHWPLVLSWPVWSTVLLKHIPVLTAHLETKKCNLPACTSQCIARLPLLERWWHFPP